MGLLNRVFDALLFFAGALTYVATAALVASLARPRWLGRSATLGFLTVTALAFSFLCARGIAFPNPNAAATPWYFTPGFIAGIPAMPWLMPYLLGVVVLRRAAVEDATPVIHDTTAR